MTLFEKIKEIYWDNKILNEEQKEKIFYKLKGLVRGQASADLNEETLNQYVQQVLDNQLLDNSFSVDYPQKASIELAADDPKLIAYYLPQFCPNEQNNAWWGKGTTEWTNVSKSVPQYVGQYQPRLPGELGFYDLRIQENIRRQVELAKFYGVYGFCFYFYWFDGLRLLDEPFNNFVNDEKIDFPFCICWVNESWTKQWSGNSNATLVEQRKDVTSYKKFITSCYELFEKDNYICVGDKPVLNIYKPNNIPQARDVINYWRKFVRDAIGKEIYLISCIGHSDDYKNNYLELGFDAVNEFAPGPQLTSMRDIKKMKSFVCESFVGKVYDYKDFVEKKAYFAHRCNKLHRAVCPMWDNTARKRNKGTILDGATPDLYKQWLMDVIQETKDNKDLDDKFVFINAWNEWAEGTYLEPDLKWQYKYLEATRDSVLLTRRNVPGG